jgi:hypothetical protein
LKLARKHGNFFMWTRELRSHEVRLGIFFSSFVNQQLIWRNSSYRAKVGVWWNQKHYWCKAIIQILISINSGYKCLSEMYRIVFSFTEASLQAKTWYAPSNVCFYSSNLRQAIPQCQ